jgi:Helicase HerA, central domain
MTFSNRLKWRNSSSASPILLFTLANDARIHSAVIQWLRCEELSRHDRELLGDLIPRPQPEMPAKTIHTLGRLMHVVGSAAFVLLVDEMESTYDDKHSESEPARALRAAVNTLVEIADAVPNAIVVLGCIHHLFTEIEQRLPGTKRDRLLQDPEKIVLNALATRDEVQAMLAARLAAIFRAAGVEPDATNPIAPFQLADIEALVGTRTRDILDNLRKHRQACFVAQSWLQPEWSTVDPPLVSVQDPWSRRWNDHQAQFKLPTPDDEPQLAELLVCAVKTISSEYPTAPQMLAKRDDRFVDVELPRQNLPPEKLLIALCNKSTRGGGLGNQVKQVSSRMGDRPAILIRSTEFPKVATQVVAKEIAQLVAPVGKGKRVVVADADWRALAAFRDFHQKYSQSPGFAEWQRTDRPLSGVTAIRVILSLDTRVLESPVVSPTAAVPVPPSDAVPNAKPPTTAVPPPKPSVQTPAVKGAISLGRTRAMTPVVVEMQALDFCRHAAFLGGSGSGKTTAALTVIEQLLMQSIPAVLIDRKGDLCRYADPEGWQEADADASRVGHRAAFRRSVETVIFTPGSEKGRPLRIPVVPDMAGLTTAEVEQIAQTAAAGLTQMMGYSQKSPDAKSVILQKAIEVLARSAPVTVKGLQQLVSDMDESLTNETEGYEEKHFKKLGQDLLTLAHMHRRLLEDGEPLSVDALLGRGSAAVPGKVRMSIVNTQFLGDDATIDFWIAQFLLCVDRWRAKSPSASLQAVFFFDEADKYLPAVGKPATKSPMEGLLKRARSAGVGIFLATQSPGDLDYKCRDQVLNWFIGRVKEPVAIAKLKPMLDRKPDAADKLAGQSAGEFYLVRESGVNAIQVDRNLMPTQQLSEDRILALSQSDAHH